MAVCAGSKRDGSRCTVTVEPPKAYCWWHDPANAEERRRAASKGGRGKGGGQELVDLKRRLKALAEDVMAGRVERGTAAVANQIWNTLIRAIEQERKQRELEELAGRLEALEKVLRGRSAQ